MYASEEELVLALRILRSFTFSHHVLGTFVHEAVVPLLASESEQLREVRDDVVMTLLDDKAIEAIYFHLHLLIPPPFFP